MFKEVVVVEGRDDTRRLKEIYHDIETLETGGSAISKETLCQIKRLNETRGVIIFTDPDFPGQQIRQKIVDEIGDCKHAYINREAAQKKKGRGIGVEHAKAEDIILALSNVMSPSATHDSSITQRYLVDLNLIGHPSSKERREKLAKSLGIGYVNGKQLLKRLNMFGISASRVEEALEGFEYKHDGYIK